VNALKSIFKSWVGIVSFLAVLVMAAAAVYSVTGASSKNTLTEADQETLDSWPSQTITIIAGNRVGGVFDIMARGLAKHLSIELGKPVVVKNISGATTKAAGYLLRQPDDGYTYLVSAPVPFMVWSMDNGDVNFNIDDLAFINNQWNSMAGLMLNNKHSFPDARSLFEAIRDNPLKYSAAILPRSGGQINMLLTLKAMGIPPENLRMIYYSSGSQLRTAVAGGQVDFGVVTHESYVSIRDFARPLAAFEPEMWIFAPEGLKPGTDVPTINQMLLDQGKAINFVPSSLKSIMASKGFQEKHPERYQKMVRLFEKVVSSDAFIEDMQKQFVAHSWQGPSISTKETQAAYNLFIEYAELLKKYE